MLAPIKNESADHNLLCTAIYCSNFTSVDSVTWQSSSCRPSFVSNYLCVAFFGDNMIEGFLKSYLHAVMVLSWCIIFVVYPM